MTPTARTTMGLLLPPAVQPPSNFHNPTFNHASNPIMHSSNGMARGIPSGSSPSAAASFSRRATYLLMIASAVPSFFLGTLLSLYASIDCQTIAEGGMMKKHGSDHLRLSDVLVENRVQSRVADLERTVRERVEEQVQLRLAEAADSGLLPGGGAAEAPGALANCPPGTSKNQTLFPKQGFGMYLAGMAKVSKEAFVRHIDPGVPLDEPKNGSSDVLILYNSLGSVPNQHRADDSLNWNNRNPRLTMPAAVENCELLHVVLQHNTGGRKQCVAIVPQYESYHIQKWMRLPQNYKELALVSRGRVEKGMDRFRPPRHYETKQFWKWLHNYLATMDDVLAELKPIVEKVAVDKTVIVLVCNLGQSELLANFVCSARARGFDLGRVLLFATDEETKELAEGLGITAFYDHRNFASTPKKAAGIYGDDRFIAMMFAKVICVQLVSVLGYNFLFQDVDVVWYKDPVQYFNDPQFKKKYDVIFQDDGGHSTRYCPYSANSGFYFAYANDRTQHFFNSLLGYGSLIISTHSHQQALIALLNEHVSLHGLRAKVVSRDSEDLPGGYQWNQKSGKYMRALFAGEIKPVIFHMSWTENSSFKQKYFKQMGEWWVQDQCVGKTKDEIYHAFGSRPDDLGTLCCAAEPLVSCHYRDKPSKIPCRDSPAIDHGKRKSFW